MDVLTTISEFANVRKFFTGSLGFVPTMGALHQGHISLIKKSLVENEKTACSIFVNPIQFNNPDDFNKYPITLERDLELLHKAGCDLVFAPSASEMYPEKPNLKFDFGALETVMEGAFRPGHFNGVAVVVSKLFHITQPTISYFGQKDLQQTQVIKRLVADLGFQTKLQIVETLRESDGLAMSSRNVRLTESNRQLSSVLFTELRLAQNRILAGESIEKVAAQSKFTLESYKEIRLEYFEIVNASTLLSIDTEYSGEIAICVAAYFEEVRLIDNIVFQRK